MSSDGTQAEFDFSEFDTEVTQDAQDRIIRAISASIDRLREQVEDDILDEMFRSDPGRYTMWSDFTRDQLDPEPLTKNRVIDPLLDTLGYERSIVRRHRFAGVLERGRGSRSGPECQVLDPDDYPLTD